jgi:hypothetical protein
MPISATPNRKQKAIHKREGKENARRKDRKTKERERERERERG